MRKTSFLILIVLLLAFITMFSVACKKSEPKVEMEITEEHLFLTFELLDDGTYEVGADYITDANVVIPSTYNGKRVSSIRAYGFKDRDILNVYLPSTITKIKEHAFDGCELLTSIKISSILSYVGESAFKGCSNLLHIYYDGTLDSWCDITFADSLSNPFSASDNENFYIENKFVDQLSFSSSLITIKKYAFYDYENATSLTLPSSINRIETGAFPGCSKLKNINYLGTWESWLSVNFEDLTANPLYNKTAGQQISFNINNTEIKNNSIVLPNSTGITTIKNHTLYGISIIIQLPSAISNIGENCNIYAAILPKEINFFDSIVLNKTNRLYYLGTQEDYNKNSNLRNYVSNSGASILFYSETNPNDSYYSSRYWHFNENSVPEVWVYSR